MKVGFLHSIIRKEEKLLLAEFRDRKEVELVKIDDRQQFFDLHKNSFDAEKKSTWKALSQILPESMNAMSSCTVPMHCVTNWLKIWDSPNRC